MPVIKFSQGANCPSQSLTPLTIPAPLGPRSPGDGSRAMTLLWNVSLKRLHHEIYFEYITNYFSMLAIISVSPNDDLNIDGMVIAAGRQTTHGKSSSHFSLVIAFHRKVAYSMDSTVW